MLARSDLRDGVRGMSVIFADRNSCRIETQMKLLFLDVAQRGIDPICAAEIRDRFISTSTQGNVRVQCNDVSCAIVWRVTMNLLV